VSLKRGEKKRKEIKGRRMEIQGGSVQNCRGKSGSTRSPFRDEEREERIQGVDRSIGG